MYRTALVTGLLAIAVGCQSNTLSCPDGSVAVSDPESRIAYCAPVCDDAGACTCPEGRVSTWSSKLRRAECSPACGSNGVDGGCPGGLTCQTCLASGDCPACAVCVAACATP